MTAHDQARPTLLHVTHPRWMSQATILELRKHTAHVAERIGCQAILTAEGVGLTFVGAGRETAIGVVVDATRILTIARRFVELEASADALRAIDQAIAELEALVARDRAEEVGS